METSAAFGIPGGCLDFVEPVLDELAAIAESEGARAACNWLDGAAAAGRVPQVVARHVREWNEAKQDDEVPYLLRYRDYAERHLEDWEAAGLRAPSLSDEFGGLLGLSPPDRSRRSKTGQNEPCGCGSGQKFKHCHGR